jgi:GNAT superfamily N-acetyltransferase
LNDLDLMSIRVATLFRLDERGRLVESNEPNPQSAPRLWVGRTLAGSVVRFGTPVSEDLTLRISGIIEREPAGADVSAAPVWLDAIRDVLVADSPIKASGGGPAYRFPVPVSSPAHVVQLTDANLGLARETFRWLHDDLAGWGPAFVVVENGVAVSGCFSSRNGAEAAEAGLETLPDFRGRGYAVAVTTAWAAAIQASGRHPIYSTAWSNLASQAVARRLGLTMFGADLSLT